MSRARRLLYRLDPIFQIGLVIGLAEVYRLLRRLIPTDWPQAIANAQHVERLERVAHFSWEQGIQAWFLQLPGRGEGDELVLPLQSLRGDRSVLRLVVLAEP